MSFDAILAGLTILFITLGALKMQPKKYTIVWRDSKDKTHTMENLCEHKKEIVASALDKAAEQGKIFYSSVLIFRDK